MGFGERAAERERAYEQRFQRGLDAAAIRRTNRALSVAPRPTGSAEAERAFATSVARLRGYGLRVATPTYGVWVSRPRDLRVTVTAPFTRVLADAPVGAPLAYNAYSASGDVEGAVVDAGQGLPSDYEDRADGVDVRGRIALVRYGGAFRGVKVDQAEQRGAKAVLLYFGAVRGRDPARNRAVPVPPPRRPAHAGRPGAAGHAADRRPGRRQPPPRIPVAPISYADAQPLLANEGSDTCAARRHGPRRSSAPPERRGHGQLLLRSGRVALDHPAPPAAGLLARAGDHRRHYDALDRAVRATTRAAGRP